MKCVNCDCPLTGVDKKENPDYCLCCWNKREKK